MQGYHYGVFLRSPVLAATELGGMDFAKKKRYMTPLDPIESVPADNPTTSGQLPGDENHVTDLVDIGRRIADTEMRDAVTEQYVDEANVGDDTEEVLADIARTEAVEDRAEDIGPETNAIHTDVPPED